VRFRVFTKNISKIFVFSKFENQKKFGHKNENFTTGFERHFVIFTRVFILCRIKFTCCLLTEKSPPQKKIFTRCLLTEKKFPKKIPSKKIPKKNLKKTFLKFKKVLCLNCSPANLWSACNILGGDRDRTNSSVNPKLKLI
jgi:hypothetical protein